MGLKWPLAFSQNLDALGVLEDKTEAFAREYENWSDWVSDELLESGELVNLIITSRQRYDAVKSPLYLNARSEGILIYDGRMPGAYGPGKNDNM